MSDIKSNYATLCKLHSRYKYLINSIVKNAYSIPVPNTKMNELNAIMRKVENLPISWEFYVNQHCKFAQDFEDLVIFYNEIGI